MQPALATKCNRRNSRHNGHNCTPADFHDAIQFYQDRVPLARAAQKLRD